MTPCMGIVLHMLNIRLFPEQLTYIANHAQDKVIFVDDSLVPLLEKVAPTFETVEHYVIVGDGDAGSLPNVLRYEDLIAEQEAGVRVPGARRAHTPRGSATRAARPATRRASCTRTARTCCTASASGLADTLGHHGVRPCAARCPDVPRERLGPPVRVRDGRGRPRDARALPPGRAAGEADRGREGHGRRRRSDDLDGPAALRGRDTSRTSPACEP